MAKKKNMSRVGFLAAVIVIILLLLYIRNIQDSSSEEKTDSEVSFIDMSELLDSDSEVEDKESLDDLADDTSDNELFEEDEALMVEETEADSGIDEASNEDVSDEDVSDEDDLGIDESVDETDEVDTIVDEEPTSLNTVDSQPDIQQIRSEDTLSDAIFLEVTEGDLVSFPNLKVKDPDGDKIEFSFSDPLNEKGEWQTKEGDEGTYDIIITASDGRDKTSKQITVVVLPLNKAPQIEIADRLVFKEAETVVLDPIVTDPEGDAVEVSYSGWMASNRKATGYDDAGEHEVTITISDGDKEVAKTIIIVIEDVNRKPTFVSII